MSEVKSFEEIKPEYCCIDLFRAVESQTLTVVVSGIWFLGVKVKLNFCPFCGAEIITTREDSTWEWRTEKRKDSK